MVAGSTAGTEQNEVRSITAIVGQLVYLDRPLSFNHVPGTAGAEINVANLSRNVVIASESSVIDRRGHTMFMHNRDIHIANVEFYQLGRTDKSKPINDPVVDANWQLKPGTGTNPRARYAVHFHRNGFIDDGNPSTVSGSVVWGSPGWGFVNHSSYVDMSDNVAFDVHGAAFTTEVGDEIGSFRNNLAIGTKGSGEDVNSRRSIQDFGHQGDGFWFQGTGVAVTGNISAGNDGSAFIVYAQGLIEGGIQKKFLAANLPDPTLAGGNEQVDVSSVPMRQFDHNVGYASKVGLAVRYHLQNATHDAYGVFSDSMFWNNELGVNLEYAHQVIMRNVIVKRIPEDTLALATNTGISSNLVTRNIVYQDLTVAGYNVGVVLPRVGTTTVIGGSYANHTDLQILTAISPDRNVLLTGNITFNRIVTYSYFDYPSYGNGFMFYADLVILNFGPFKNQPLYYTSQAPDAVPFPSGLPALPAAYIGLTSQQLWSQFGIAIGGSLAPAEATSVPSIVGLIGPAT